MLRAGQAQIATLAESATSVRGPSVSTSTQPTPHPVAIEANACAQPLALQPLQSGAPVYAKPVSVPAPAHVCANLDVDAYHAHDAQSAAEFFEADDFDACVGTRAGSASASATSAASSHCHHTRDVDQTTSALDLSNVAHATTGSSSTGHRPHVLHAAAAAIAPEPRPMDHHDDVDFAAELGHCATTKHLGGVPRFKIPGFERGRAPPVTAAAAYAPVAPAPVAQGLGSAAADMMMDDHDDGDHVPLQLAEEYFVAAANVPAADVAAAGESSGDDEESDRDADEDPAAAVAPPAVVDTSSAMNIAGKPGHKPPAVVPVKLTFDPQQWFFTLYSILQTSVLDVFVQNTLLTDVIVPILQQLRLLSMVVYLYNLKNIAMHLVLCWMCTTASSYRSANFLLGIVGVLVNLWSAGRVSFPATIKTMLSQNAYLQRHCKIVPRIYCQLCYSVYTQEACTEMQGGVCRTKLCSHREFPNHPNPTFRGACGLALMGKKSQKILNGTTVQSDFHPYPSQTYYYLGTCTCRA